MIFGPEIKARLIEEARAATTPAARGTLVDSWIAAGYARSTILKAIRDAGIAPTRKSAGGRKPAHNLTPERFERLIAPIQSTRRKTGQKIVGVARALEIGELRGEIKQGEVSVSQIRHLMKKSNLLVRDLLSPEPTAEHRADYPNEVQFFDASVCLKWRFDTPKKQMEWRSWSLGLEQNKIIDTISRDQKKDKRYIWRLALTDRYSGLIYFRYYLTEGESTIFVAQFLEDAWFRKENPAMIFCGIPKLLIADQGPGNASAPIKNLCKSYGIDYRLHSTGRSTAKGQVEGAHNIIQHTFESLLAITVPVWDIDELNRRAEDWQAKYNNNAILTRNRRRIGTRNSLWSTVASNQLRVPDDRAAFRLAASYGERELPVSARGIVRTKIKHPGDMLDFRVPVEFKSIWGREKIRVIINPFEWRDHQSILVSVDGKSYMRAKHIGVDQAGQHTDATHYLTPRRTATNAQQQFRDRADAMEFTPAAWPEFQVGEARQIAASANVTTGQTAVPQAKIEQTYGSLDARLMIYDALPGLPKHLREAIRDRILGPLTTSQIDAIITEYREFSYRATGSAAG